MIECKRAHAFDAPCDLCFPDDSKCGVCGEDHDYDDHQPGSELQHEFEPEFAIEAVHTEPSPALLEMAALLLSPETQTHSRGKMRSTRYRVAVALQEHGANLTADAALAWRRVTELQERGTQLVLERRKAVGDFDALLTRLRDFVDDADNRALATHQILVALDQLLAGERKP